MTSQCKRSAAVEVGPSLTPAKLLDGLTAFLKVSSATATPGIPEKPSPPPPWPTDVGAAPREASPNTSASPSAPEPPPIVASYSTVMFCALTAVGQNAVPACAARGFSQLQFVAVSFAEPFNLQPPAVGSGTLVGGGGGGVSGGATRTIGATDGTPAELTMNSM